MSSKTTPLGVVHHYTEPYRLKECEDTAPVLGDLCLLLKKVTGEKKWEKRNE